MARLHIRAWGSDEYPDMDEFLDEYPAGLLNRYPMVSVAMLRVISKEKLDQALKEHGYLSSDS